jgi:hypothetical protein
MRNVTPWHRLVFPAFVTVKGKAALSFGNHDLAQEEFPGDWPSGPSVV